MRTDRPAILWLYAGTMLASATLLFLVQPMIGKLLLPALGGSPAVWNTCMVFFQLVLLLGYFYAHVVTTKLAPRQQAIVHGVMLVGAFVMLPFGAVVGAPPAEALPIGWLLGTLAALIGLPFLVLSTSAPLLQAWFARTDHKLASNPYPLYSASNLGSMMSLFSYPFLVEPVLGAQQQTQVWSIVYLGFGALLLICASVVWRIGPQAEAPAQAAEVSAGAAEDAAAADAAPTSARPTWRDMLSWTVLSAIPSSLTLGVTTHLSTDISALPLLWILPLALYLLSFILVFGGRARVLALSRRSWPEAALLCAALLLIGPTRLWLGALLLVAFWMYCMAAHAAMYARRPPSTSLTRFYLATSLGGGLGGALVTLVAPRVFNRHLELPILLLGFVAAMAWWSGRETLRFFREGHILAIAPRLLLLGALAAAAAFMPMVTHDQEPLQTHRNFYGVFEIIDRPVAADDPRTLRKMRHNGTLHGAELRDRRPTEPTTVAYFHPAGAIAAVYAASAGEPRKIAVMGLGTGSVAAFMTPKDTLHFFEIDPDNERLAREWFTFMNTSRARHLEVFVGDGRLLLSDARTGRVPYDLIHMDAFSGDGIPTHLLTIEAMERYLTRLAPDGVLLFHVSNRYYNLLPLLRQLAITYNLHAVTNRRHVQLNPATGKPDPLYQETQCVVMTRDPARLDPLRKDPRWVGLRELPLPTVRLWRDALIDIFSPLRLKMTLDAPEAASPAPPTTTTGAGQ